MLYITYVYIYICMYVYLNIFWRLFHRYLGYTIDIQKLPHFNHLPLHFHLSIIYVCKYAS